MSGPALKVGDKAAHVEQCQDVAACLIRTVTIVRETKTQWVDDAGCRWRKLDGAKVPWHFSTSYERLMSLSEFETANVALAGQS